MTAEATFPSSSAAHCGSVQHTWKQYAHYEWISTGACSITWGACSSQITITIVSLLIWHTYIFTRCWRYWFQSEGKVLGGAVLPQLLKITELPLLRKMAFSYPACHTFCLPAQPELYHQSVTRLFSPGASSTNSRTPDEEKHECRRHHTK